MDDQPVACCEEFAKQSQLQEFAGGGMMYPQEQHSRAQIEWANGWQVYGCCGGGCYVLTDLRFCPWCGAELPEMGEAV